MGLEPAYENWGNRNELTVAQLEVLWENYRYFIRMRTFPYLRERVWSDIAPSEKNAWTSATSKSPSSKNKRICSSSLSSFRRWTPPGKLTEDSIRTASCREFASTFHRRGCTWSKKNVQFYRGSNRQITCFRDSPNDKIANFWVIPRPDCTYGDKLVYPFNCARHGWDDLFIIHIRSMTTVLYSTPLAYDKIRKKLDCCGPHVCLWRCYRFAGTRQFMATVEIFFVVIKV